MQTRAAMFAATFSIFCAACSGGPPALDGGEETSAALRADTRPRRGISIDSPSVDPNKTYWGSRPIRFLEEVGALDAQALSLARRADGVIANAPADGHLAVDELARLETQLAGALHPAERAAIGKLWSVLDQGSITAVVLPPRASIALTLHDDHANQSRSPRHVAISTLPPALHSVAARVQLLRDGDGNPSTITGLDVSVAYGARQALLPSEVSALRELTRALAVGAESFPDSLQRVIVTSPKPGVTPQAIGGGARLDVITRVRPTRTERGYDAYELTLAATTELRLAGLAGGRLLRMHATTGEVNEVAIGSDGTAHFDSAAHVFELWRSGARVIFTVKAPDAVESARLPEGADVVIDGTTYRFGCYTSSTSATCEYRADGSRALSAPVPSGAYVGADRPGTRLDVFESGRAIFHDGTRKLQCLPRLLGGEIRGCELETGVRVTYGSFVLAQDDPALGSGPGGTLYPL